jgi:hypothetical protein
MRETKLLLAAVTLLLCGFSTNVQGAEEALDLSKETEVKAPAAKPVPPFGGLRLMGRVDLTGEYRPNAASTNDGLKNYHFLLFLKVPASEKVSFMGEFVNRAFYEVTYKASPLVKFHFGKIVVPFGDTTYYHHFYGGVQGYGAQGVMFPNVWAESGANAEWNMGSLIIDTYAVNGIEGSSTTNEPDFQADPTGQRQAGGLRATYTGIAKIKAIVSGYYTDWAPSKSLLLAGGDLVTDYGLIDAAVLRNLRLSAGRAVGFVQGSSSGNFQRAGDYLQLATNAMGFAEARARYGTYVHNSNNKTSSDTHSMNVGLTIPVDVMKLLVEYQWNFEAVSEINNDLARVMLSLDF